MRAWLRARPWIWVVLLLAVVMLINLAMVFIAGRPPQELR